MLGDAPGNSGFDPWFLVLELLAFAVLVGLAFFTRHWPAPLLWPAWGLCALIVVAVPVIWYVVLPPQAGLDAAGRLFVGVPVIAINLGLLVFAALRVRSG